jgi:protein-tyrosine phosphatase
MTDIHCHIIPGVDDGARDMDEAVALVKLEVSGGTTTFIATPHVIEKVDYGRLEAFAKRAEELRNVLCDGGIDARIIQGAEVYPSFNMLEAIEKGLPITVGGLGRHVLLDLPQTTFPQDFDSLLYGIQVKGLTPILAHPERCGKFQHEPDLVAAYREKSVLIQVNGASLKGRYGSRAQEVATYILKKHWADFVASDAHRPSRGGPILGTARTRLVELIGQDYARHLTETAPEALSRGANVPATPPAPRLEQGFFARFLRRG